MFDVIIRGARIFDGTGGAAFCADVAIKDDAVAAVGDLGEESAGLEIEARGMALAPGFIDIHTHSDMPLMLDGDANSHIRQGVTTNVIGNCGTALAPVTPEAVEYLKSRTPSDEEAPAWDWLSMAEYLQRLEESGVSVNVVPLAGQGSIRGSVMGFVDRAPTEEELQKMKGMVREAMEDGAFGMSTGLIYVPGSYAATDEIVELAEVVGEYGGLYASHIRGENDTLIPALEEAIEVGRRADVPVQVSHLKAMGRHMWGRSADALQLIDRARSEGIDITADQYPYNASATGLGAYLPAWAHVGGSDELMKRLSDEDTREKIKEHILSGDDEWTSLYKGVGWENTMITRCKVTDLEGKMVTEIADERGIDPFDCAFDILLEAGGNVGVVYFTIGDEDLERIMRHPSVMIGSDSSAIGTEGPTARGKPHPRSFGTFSRVLGKYVREDETIGLAEAIKKMTSMPAGRLGLTDRGVLRPDARADLVLFDPDTVADCATYKDPFRYPEGVLKVFVNGQLTISDGEHTKVRAGRVLRRP